jgi:hypothetical protein
MAMDTKFFEEYQKQLLEWQRTFFNTWLESLPKGTMEVNVNDTFATTLKLQEETVKAFLETQEKTTQMMLEAQKQFWTSYFDLLQKEPVAAAN